MCSSGLKTKVGKLIIFASCSELLRPNRSLRGFAQHYSVVAANASDANDGHRRTDGRPHSPAPFLPKIMTKGAATASVDCSRTTCWLTTSLHRFLTSFVHRQPRRCIRSTLDLALGPSRCHIVLENLHFIVILERIHVLVRGNTLHTHIRARLCHMRWIE